MSKGPRPNAVHGSRLQVHQNGSGHILVRGGLIVVDTDAFQLQVRVPHIVAAGVYAMLVTDDLPELCEDGRKKFTDI